MESVAEDAECSRVEIQYSLRASCCSWRMAGTRAARETTLPSLGGLRDPAALGGWRVLVLPRKPHCHPLAGSRAARRVEERSVHGTQRTEGWVCGAWLATGTRASRRTVGPRNTRAQGMGLWRLAGILLLLADGGYSCFPGNHKSSRVECSRVEI